MLDWLIKTFICGLFVFLLAMTCLISYFTEHPTPLLICFKQKICKQKDTMAHFRVQAKSHI